MNVGAFFDLDGTLVGPPSLERGFLDFLRRSNEYGTVRWTRWSAEFLRRVWRDPWAATHGNKAHYAGLRTVVLDVWSAFLRRHPPPFFPPARARLAWHTAQDHRIFVITGTLEPLAEAVANFLLFDQAVGPPLPLTIFATELETCEGRFTGGVRRATPCGPEKARVVQDLAAEHDLDLRASYAYGNSLSDYWMLARVGHPAAVNPSFVLGWLARHRGWPILAWDDSVAPSLPLPAGHGLHVPPHQLCRLGPDRDSQ